MSSDEHERKVDILIYKHVKVWKRWKTRSVMVITQRLPTDKKRSFVGEDPQLKSNGFQLTRYTIEIDDQYEKDYK